MMIPRQYIPWIGIAALCFIIYYIYFLDVNECIVEKDNSAAEGDYIVGRTNSSTLPYANITLLCPAPNISAICGNISKPEPNVTALCGNVSKLACPAPNVTAICSNISKPECPPQPAGTKGGSEDDSDESVMCPPPDLGVLCSNYTNELLILNATDVNKVECPKVDYVISGVAVLIEPRQHPSIKNVTINIIENLPKHWVIQIFTSTNASAFINSELSKYVKSGKVIVDDTFLGNKSSMRRQEYNNFLVQERLWKEFKAEKVLIFQVDSIICKDSRRDISSFLQYDFIGAPWTDSLWAKVSNGVGNGGFSLRSRSKSLEAIKKYDRAGLNEDGFFARAMVKMGANMPSYEEAKQFAVERVYYPTPFGIHRFGYERFTQEQKDQLLEYCPEIKLMGR